MMTLSRGNQRETRVTTTPERWMDRDATGPDPSWRGLYRAGGISAFLYVLLGVVVPGLLFIPVGYQRGMSGDDCSASLPITAPGG